ncbi:hypothetical protein KJ781_03205 [Patescibacteria group bacterium]|nr:hypothetical protein [Patescibacteria group bacterium]MBU1448325.1 hypothetical protein [Patescibacteria group bacterium]MBU2612859.1 hypothetical protein [Patescibacteria group bacterium]
MTTRPGFIALISVLLLSAVAMLIAGGVLIRAVGGLNMSVTNEEQMDAHLGATQCMEHALMNLRRSSRYLGNETLALQGGHTCHILPVSGTGYYNRTIQATSTVDGATRKISVVVSRLVPVLLVTSWQEVADF